MIRLYHGSNVRINDIDLTQCSPYKDFGQAFYLTTYEEQAMSVAKARVDIFGGVPIVNVFCLEEELLTDETFVPPYMHNYDVVYGSIANDRVGLQIRNYRLGNIDKQEFLRRLKYMKGITFQYAFCTQQAIEQLRAK